MLSFQRKQQERIITRQTVLITSTVIVITVRAGVLVITVYAVVITCPMVTTSHVSAAMVDKHTSAAAVEYSTTGLVLLTSSGLMTSRSVLTLVAPAENAQDRSVP